MRLEIKYGDFALGADIEPGVDFADVLIEVAQSFMTDKHKHIPKENTSIDADEPTWSIADYQLIRDGEHPTFKTTTEFFNDFGYRYDMWHAKKLVNELVDLNKRRFFCAPELLTIITK